MAKKKFNISSTLKKNTKEEKVELAPKIPLKKSVKDPEAVKSKVEAIHADRKPVKAKAAPKLVEEEAIPVEEPKSKPATKKTTSEERGRMVRMTIDTPEEMHLQLKIKSIQSRMSMRDYVLKLIEKDLKKGK